jgi:hypothetical protein
MQRFAREHQECSLGTVGSGRLDMTVSEEPAAVAALAAFAAIGFLLLLCLAKGSLSERQQTGVWVAWTVLFFSVCSVLVRSSTESRAHTGNAPALSDSRDLRLYK